MRGAALVCLAGALAAGVPASTAAGRTAAPAAIVAGAGTVGAPRPAVVPVTVVVDCSGEARVRPADYLLACGDGNNRLVGLRWDTWGAVTATATGTDMVNDCVPYCAAGRFRGYPVNVTLSGPEPWPGHPGTSRFTTVRLVFPGPAPSPLPHDVTYRIVWADGRPAPTAS